MALDLRCCAHPRRRKASLANWATELKFFIPNGPRTRPGSPISAPRAGQTARPSRASTSAGVGPSPPAPRQRAPDLLPPAPRPRGPASGSSRHRAGRHLRLARPATAPGRSERSIPLTRARQVTGPTMPSTVTGDVLGRACWKPRAAASVLGPNIPSTCSPLLGSPDRLRNWNSSCTPADGVALAALLDRDDQRRPGVRTDDAVDRQALLLLKGADGGVGARPEDAVHGDVVAAGPEQVLQGLDGMPPGCSLRQCRSGSA